jgi:hypothetical protein
MNARCHLSLDPQDGTNSRSGRDNLCVCTALHVSWCVAAGRSRCRFRRDHFLLRASHSLLIVLQMERPKSSLLTRHYLADVGNGA